MNRKSKKNIAIATIFTILTSQAIGISQVYANNLSLDLVNQSDSRFQEIESLEDLKVSNKLEKESEEITIQGNSEDKETSEKEFEKTTVLEVEVDKDKLDESSKEPTNLESSADKGYLEKDYEELTKLENQDNKLKSEENSDDLILYELVDNETEESFKIKIEKIYQNDEGGDIKYNIILLGYDGEKSYIETLKLPELKSIKNTFDLSNIDDNSINLIVGENFAKNSSNLESIEELIVPSGYTTIGDYAFEFKSISKIKLSDVKKIGNGAFYTNNLTELDIPKLEVIGDYAFSYNPIEKINLPKVKKIGNKAFLSNNLTKLDLPNLEVIGKDTFSDNLIEEINLSKFILSDEDYELVFKNLLSADNNYLLIYHDFFPFTNFLIKDKGVFINPYNNWNEASYKYSLKEITENNNPKDVYTFGGGLSNLNINKLNLNKNYFKKYLQSNSRNIDILSILNLDKDLNLCKDSNNFNYIKPEDEILDSKDNIYNSYVVNYSFNISLLNKFIQHSELFVKKDKVDKYNLDQDLVNLLIEEEFNKNLIGEDNLVDESNFDRLLKKNIKEIARKHCKSLSEYEIDSIVNQFIENIKNDSRDYTDAEYYRLVPELNNMSDEDSSSEFKWNKPIWNKPASLLKVPNNNTSLYATRDKEMVYRDLAIQSNPEIYHLFIPGKPKIVSKPEIKELIKMPVDDYKTKTNTKTKTKTKTKAKTIISKKLNTKDHIKYIQGYPDGSIRANDYITREEVAAIFFRLLEPTYRESIRVNTVNYSDFEVDRWSIKHIGSLSNGNILTGYPGNEFRPTSMITRAEVATIASRFDNLERSSFSKFSDVKGHWAEEYIDSAESKGWVNGYNDGNFRPDEPITRAEFVTLVNNVLNRKVNKENILEGIKNFSDLYPEQWYYEAIVEASNSHEYEEVRLKDNSEMWTKFIYPDVEM